GTHKDPGQPLEESGDTGGQTALGQGTRTGHSWVGDVFPVVTQQLTQPVDVDVHHRDPAEGPVVAAETACLHGQGQFRGAGCRARIDQPPKTVVPVSAPTDPPGVCHTCGHPFVNVVMAVLGTAAVDRLRGATTGRTHRGDPVP